MNRYELHEAPGPRDSLSFEEAARFLRVDAPAARRAALLGELPITSVDGDMRIDLVALRVLLNPYLLDEHEGAEG